MNLVNEWIKTFNHTYYFSISSGDRMRSRSKQREVFNDPKKHVNNFIGFESNAK